MRIFLICLIFAMVFTSINSNAQNKLTIVVEGIEEVKGTLYVAVYNSPETFMKQVFSAEKKEIKIEVVKIEFTDLSAGEYAVSLYQDENGNGKLDTGTFGIPTEKYGFSNNPQSSMGPPNFKACKFEIQSDTVINIKVH